MKAALFFLAPVLMVVGGCAADRGIVRTPSGLELTGRVVSRSQVTGMVGDVAELWDAYTIAPQGRSGGRVVVVDAANGCRLTDAPETLYRFSLYQPSVAVFAITKGSEAEATSDLFVVSCEKIDPSGIVDTGRAQ